MQGFRQPQIVPKVRFPTGFRERDKSLKLSFQKCGWEYCAHRQLRRRLWKLTANHHSALGETFFLAPTAAADPRSKGPKRWSEFPLRIFPCKYQEASGEGVWEDCASRGRSAAWEEEAFSRDVRPPTQKNVKIEKHTLPNTSPFRCYICTTVLLLAIINVAWMSVIPVGFFVGEITRGSSSPFVTRWCRTGSFCMAHAKGWLRGIAKGLAIWFASPLVRARFAPRWPSKMGWSDTLCEKATWSLSWHISGLILSSSITLKRNCASKFRGCRMDPIKIVLSDNKIEPNIVSFLSRRSAALLRNITFIKLWKSQFWLT